MTNPLNGFDNYQAINFRWFTLTAIYWKSFIKLPERDVWISSCIYRRLTWVFIVSSWYDNGGVPKNNQKSTKKNYSTWSEKIPIVMHEGKQNDRLWFMLTFDWIIVFGTRKRLSFWNAEIGLLVHMYRLCYTYLC